MTPRKTKENRSPILFNANGTKLMLIGIHLTIIGFIFEELILFILIGVCFSIVGLFVD